MIAMLDWLVIFVVLSASWLIFCKTAHIFPGPYSPVPEWCCATCSIEKVSKKVSTWLSKD